MANSETSFDDRLGRSRQLHAAIASFDPAFAPMDDALRPDAFASFLDEVENLNRQTNDLVDQYTVAAGERREISTDFYHRAGRVLALVKSHTAWKRYLRTVKAIVDKTRGNRPRPQHPPTSNETTEQRKRRNQGERSYAELEAHLNRLILALGKIEDYAPPAPELSLAALETLAASLHAHNLKMDDLGQNASMMQKQRRAAYDGDGGLREQMKAIKAAARAQYGTTSDEYLSVKSIKL